ncbi:MAG: DNA mismatch repair protein MutS [Candidatus Pelagibacter sp. TMED253]|nr:MAG: DNA mismatch repair protein MutS [Candidatus Pelagibacter sp. TMED253]
MIKKKNISQEDINTWKNYIKNPIDITNKDSIQNDSKLNYNRFKYDLHGFTLLEANEKVKEIILSCVKKNYNEILLVTGKGIHSNTEKDVYASKNLSKLKYSVPEFIKLDLDLSKLIVSISNADKVDGGDGAIIIKLKKL